MSRTNSLQLLRLFLIGVSSQLAIAACKSRSATANGGRVAEADTEIPDETEAGALARPCESRALEVADKLVRLVGNVKPAAGYVVQTTEFVTERVGPLRYYYIGAKGGSLERMIGVGFNFNEEETGNCILNSVKQWEIRALGAKPAGTDCSKEAAAIIKEILGEAAYVRTASPGWTGVDFRNRPVDAYSFGPTTGEIKAEALFLYKKDGCGLSNLTR